MNPMLEAQYESLMEMLSDFILREEAEERMEHYDASENRTQEQMMQEFGITQSELDAEDVELESRIDTNGSKNFLESLIFP